MRNHNDDPKAEFHDIGKLINWKAVGLRSGAESDPHEFERCIEPQDKRTEWGVNLQGSAWRAIVRKDRFRGVRNSQWPNSRAWIFTGFGDNMAAGYGRTVPERAVQGDPNHGYHCLWTGKDEADPRLRDKDDLRELIKFLNDDPTWADAQKRYRSLFLRRAETARPGLNVTTLLAHSEVAGKLARVISRLDWSDVSPEATWDQAKQEACRSARRITVCHYRVRFAQRPYRARDLNVLSALRERVGSLQMSFPDNVLSAFDDQVIAVFESDDTRSRFETAITEAGFFAYKRSQTKTIAEWVKQGINPGTGEWATVYPGYPPTRIELPICENCQMAHATKKWPGDRRQAPTDEEERYAEDDLCERCFQLRERQEAMSKLAKWREGSVLWLSVRLDLDQLKETLTEMNRRYLREKAKAVADDIVKSLYIPYPVVVDFVRDYDAFLKCVHEFLTATQGDERVERPLDNLWCIRLESRSEVLKLLEDLFNAFRSRFPKLVSPSRTGSEGIAANAENVEQDLVCPVRFALSVSNVKHPFFEHFRFFEKSKAEVEINLVGSGQAAFRLVHTPKVLASLKAVSPHAIHRLAAVAGVSEALAKVVLKDNSERGMDMTAVARLIPEVTDFEGVRTLVNLSNREKSDGQDA